MNNCVTLMENLLHVRFMMTIIVINQFTVQVGLTIGSIGSSVVNNITFRWLSYSSFFRCSSISSTYQCAMHIRGSPHIMSAAGVVEIDKR